MSEHPDTKADALVTQPAEPSCASCGAALRRSLDLVRDPETKEDFQIRRCEACGLGQTWPAPAPAALGRYYGERYHGGRRGFTEGWAIRRRTRWARKVAPTPGTLLDVGCGDGTFLLAMQEQGWKVAGTELNPARARELGLRVAERLEDAEQLGAPFGLITLWHSLEHLPRPRAALTQLSSLLAPDGVLLLAVPNSDGLHAQLFGPHWLHLDVPRHLFHFGPRSVQKLLMATGFEPFARWDAELEYDLLGFLQSAQDMISPTPRVLFDTLRGKTPRSAPERWVYLFAGALLSPLALLTTGLGAGLGMGGTLVVAAKKARQAEASGVTTGVT